MKLRNKKTGEEYEPASKDAIDVYFYAPVADGVALTKRSYDSISKLNEEWEDYEPKEPLIKDEKIRKATPQTPREVLSDAVMDAVSVMKQALAEICAVWRRAFPYIKDEPARKAIRAWAEANSILGDEKVEVSTPTVDCTILTLTYGMTSIDIMISEETTLENHGRYTIDELCGEEAPEPKEPSFIDLDERIREKEEE